MPRRNLHWTVILALLGLLSSRFAAADAAPPLDKTLSPYFVIENGDPALDQLPLKDTQVDVTITGVIADVTVRQFYENRGARPLHARYVFPASTRAAVYGMSMTVGDRRVVARIEEKHKAAAQFEKAKADGKSATLLEESRPNVFTMNVANLMPNDAITVELHYTELLVPDDGQYELVYPTVVGPRYSSKSGGERLSERQLRARPYTHQGEAPGSELHLTAKLSTGVPIYDLGSPSHQIVVASSDPAHAQVVARRSRALLRQPRLHPALSAVGAEHQLRPAALPGQGRELLPPHGAAAEDGSSRGRSAARVRLRARRVGLDERLSARYGQEADGRARSVCSSRPTRSTSCSSPTGRPCSPRNRSPSARRTWRAPFASSDRPRAGAAPSSSPPCARRFALPHDSGVARSVVLVTDGYIDAEGGVFDFIRDHLDHANVFAFGIGSGVNRYLIEGVARAGQGEPFVVTKPEEASAAAAKLREYIKLPVLTDVHLAFSGFDAYDVEPPAMPDVFASRPLVVFGKWRGPLGGSIELRGKSGREPYQVSLPVTEAALGDDHRALRYLWARSRVATLADYGESNPDAARVAQITALGLDYTLLTPFTSFIAVEERIRNTGGATRRRPTAPPAARRQRPRRGTERCRAARSRSSPGWPPAVLAMMMAGYLLQTRRQRAAAFGARFVSPRSAYAARSRAW